MDILSQQPIKDVFGNIILCEGSWKDPKNAEQLISAVGALHAAKGHRETFYDSCEDCIKAENIGCRFHRGSPLLWRKGNPKNCTLIEDVLNKNTKDGSDYVAEGDSPLTPWELMDIRQHLVNSNDLFDFQIFVMILLSVKLFLRADEICSLKIENFNQDLFVLSEKRFVEGLAVTIQGKSDKVPVTLMIWADQETPKFCPVRHLLVYLNETQITGYIFPSKKKSSSFNFVLTFR